MRKIARNLVAFAALAAPALAQAGPACTNQPRENWIAEDAMKAKLPALGFDKIKTFKVTGSCYEIYGYTKDGQKAEVYFNPVSGDIVKSYIGG